MTPRLPLTGVVAALALAGCGSPQPDLGPPSPPGSGKLECVNTIAPMARALIGPDASVRALCGQPVQMPVASVDAEGGGLVSWEIAVAGDPAFSAPSPNLQSCVLKGPAVAFVTFTPPLTAVPGDSFDAVATVHADDGSFPDGTVKLHADVAAPSISASQTVFDFGDVAPGDTAAAPLDLRVDGDAKVALALDAPVQPPFHVTPLDSAQGSMPAPTLVFDWRVSFTSSVPGDYSASVSLLGTPAATSALPQACGWTQAITMHARVLGDGGVDDGGPSADGGSDGS